MRAALLIAAGLLFAGCPESGARPDITCTAESMTDVLRSLSRLFSKGFSEEDARKAMRIVASAKDDSLYYFEYDDIMFRGRASKQFTFHLRRKGDGRIEMWVLMFDDIDMQLEIIEEIRRLGSSGCG